MPTWWHQSFMCLCTQCFGVSGLFSLWFVCFFCFCVLSWNDPISKTTLHFWIISEICHLSLKTNFNGNLDSGSKKVGRPLVMYWFLTRYIINHTSNITFPTSQQVRSWYDRPCVTLTCLVGFNHDISLNLNQNLISIKQAIVWQHWSNICA